MAAKLYLNGLGLAHPFGSLAELLAAFSGNVSSESAPQPSIKELLPGVNLRRVPRSARMAIEAAALALRDAGLPAKFSDEDAARAGVFTGSAHCCVEASFGFMDSIIDFGAKLSSPTAFSLSVNNVFTGMISLNLNTRGPSYTACQFGASFAGALSAAAGSLLTGGCELALVGAVEENSPLLGEVYKAGLNGSVNAVPDSDLKAGVKSGVQAGEKPSGADWELPATECAVFFALGLEKGPAGVEIEIPVWSPGKDLSPDMLFSILPESGCMPACRLDCRGLYGPGPAMQALDIALAYSALRYGLVPAPVWCGGAPPNVESNVSQGAPQSAVCECFSALCGAYSAVFLRKV